MTTTTSQTADIIIVGGGPAGLAFARLVADTGLNIVVIEKNSEDSLANPAYDGREIALTHASKRTMQDIDAWGRIDETQIHLLKDASVLDGNSPYQLYFGVPSQFERKLFGNDVDNLGYLVSNNLIRKAVYDSVKTQQNIRLLCGIGVKNVSTNDVCSYVELENGEKFDTPLLVIADSRFSASRRQIGISADSHDFGRSMIVCRMEHTLSNHHRAVECFYYGVTLALLPLTENVTNCVITVNSQEAQDILALNADDFAKKVTQYIGGQLGEMKLISTQHTYPLVGVHANRFYQGRAVLIGDSAVGMHPVTAHGFNLGLNSVAVLSKLVKQAVAKNQDYGSQKILARYEREHMLITRPMYHGTNAMVKLFTTDSKPAKLARSAVLRISNNLPPLKALITKQLTG
nr:5-demethoxyubiquinol-8 5-hydroxylase UbiM [uncultured Moraxella sp.]